MGQKNIMLGFYDQKPLGTRREDLENSLFSCYKPLLTYLYTHPEISVSLYLSGMIYEWLESDYPEINMLISDMVKRKQIELLTGGWYDPILSVIPVKDRTQQIEMMTTFIRKRFGQRPRSAWITEQVWNPSLINTLSLCGIKVLVQQQEPGRGEPYVMQELGKTLRVMPVDQHMGELLLKEGNEEELDIYAAALQAKDNCDHTMIMMDMNRIMSESLIENHNTVVEICQKVRRLSEESPFDSVTVSRLNNVRYVNRGFLPEGWYKKDPDRKHYHEMMLKYPEIQKLYGKILYVSKLIPGIKKERSLKKIVSKELLKAESFGSFTVSQNGGVYQNYLRKKNYSHIIEGEKISREKGVFITSLSTYDIDLDGKDEYVYRGKNISAVIDERGASLSELDYLINSWNYLDTFVGHSEDSIIKSIPSIPDEMPQNSFKDMILLQKPEGLIEEYKDPDVLSLEQEMFDLVSLDKDKKKILFSYQNAGHPQLQRIRIEKQYICHINTIEVEYRIENISDEEIRWNFATEMNISFVSDTPEMVSIAAVDGSKERSMDKANILSNVKLLNIYDRTKRSIVSLYSDERYRIQKRHYRTTINTMLGEEDIYQYTQLICSWDLQLRPGEVRQMNAAIRMKKEHRRTTI